MSNRQSQRISCFIVLAILIPKVWCLRCFECGSTEDADCGPMFVADKFEPSDCGDDPTTVCGYQYQPSIPGKQVPGVIRSCYNPGSVTGLDGTLGCSEFSGVLGDFTATFCFCDTDLCNGASASGELATSTEIVEPTIWSCESDLCNRGSVNRELATSTVIIGTMTWILTSAQWIRFSA